MAHFVSLNQIQIQIGLVLLVRPDTRDDTSQPWKWDAAPEGVEGQTAEIVAQTPTRRVTNGQMGWIHRMMTSTGGSPPYIGARTIVGTVWARLSGFSVWVLVRTRASGIRAFRAFQSNFYYLKNDPY